MQQSVQTPDMVRTPPSLRTNVELLMASMAPGASRGCKQEMVDLRARLLKIENCHTGRRFGGLIPGDAEVVQPVDMADVVDRGLGRSGGGAAILFDVEGDWWQVCKRCAGLSRMALNLMDNTKWNPAGRPRGCQAGSSTRRA